MASLLLSTVGSSVGGALFGSFGGLIGRSIGGAFGRVIDSALIKGTEHRDLQGPRLSDLTVMSSSEGAPIPRSYGRARLSGQLIWATNLEEVVSTSTQSSGGKGLPQPTTTTTTYSYYANLAIGLCEGPIGPVLRVWADGKPLDLTGLTIRVYPGSETQDVDALIAAKQGADNAPAYRGLAYVVFERLPLADFGNRIPQLSFEVVRPIGALEQMVRAVTLIPGATEFGYEPATVVRSLGPGQSAPENRHVFYAASDIEASLDELQALCPLLERVAIVVAWFGTDLRAGNCAVKPAVDNGAKQTTGGTWSVAGLDRAAASVVSNVDGRPAFGGTPSDQSVTDLIAALKARGLKVTLYPYLLMDIAAGNALTDPWTGAASQPAYPWRGRISCDPAPGQSGSPDGTSAAADQVNAFFGDTGPDDWSYRRMVLHYADLAASAGGVDAFLIGSELKGLTRVRSASGVYPAVDALVTLAGDVKAVVGSGTVVTYGADWTEYGSYVVDADASEVRFPLDPLWASSSIDAVGIDYYAPLSDWRDSADELDRALTTTIYDRNYLATNLSAGEDYDWYYADDAARAAQTRTPITDGLNKPWLFRAKDLWNWWSNQHIERVGGAELASPTAWVPESKPVWLTEFGCPAVDKGSNQPSTFPDAKSSENGLPYFSNGARDDFIQRRALEAVLARLDPAFGASDADNPVSTVTGQRMVDVSGVQLWTWDARPFPAFPALADVWSDAANWETGHWLTGRLGGAPLDALVAAVLADCAIGGCDSSALIDIVDGYVVDRPMPPRAMLDPLSLAYAFDAGEDGDTLRFRPRGGLVVAELDEDDLVLTENNNSDNAPFKLVRAQETELPRVVSISFTDIGAEYRRSAVTSRRLVGTAQRTSQADLAVVTSDTAAERRAEIWLQDIWAGRDSGAFALPPSRLALMTGDVIALTANGRRRMMEIEQIVDTPSRALQTRSVDPEIFDLPLAVPHRATPVQPVALGPVHALALDLPTLTSSLPTVLQWLAVSADPWPGPVAVWRSRDGASYERLAIAEAPSVTGVTLDDLPAGPTSRWDHGNSVRVQLYGGALSSVSDLAALNGSNAAAVQNADGAWEVIQFATAELTDDGVYELSTLLRGQAGSEWAMASPLAAGAPFVLLGQNLIPLTRSVDDVGRTMSLRIVAANRDYSDPSALALEVTPQTTALRPLTPVHLDAVRGDDGVAFSWIRRTRIGGDSWEVSEVPLGEDSEAYAVDILSGATVVRTLDANTPTALYAAAAEIADFGAPQSSLSVTVTQLSATVGRGFAAAATFSF